ncbi:MAG: hypothetical protein ACYCST_10125 [Acidimicrobiales bacterium]
MTVRWDGDGWSYDDIPPWDDPANYPDTYPDVVDRYEPGSTPRLAALGWFTAECFVLTRRDVSRLAYIWRIKRAPEYVLSSAFLALAAAGEDLPLALDSNWRLQPVTDLSALCAMQDTALALFARDLISEDDFDSLVEPWRLAVGEPPWPRRFPRTDPDPE